MKIRLQRLSPDETNLSNLLKIVVIRVWQQTLPQGVIENKILLLRGKKVMLDRDLARLYGISTGNLNKAVKRNIERFPDDFMLQLTKDEEKSLRFHFGSLKRGQHAKYLPYAFTEQGVAMLSRFYAVKERYW